MEVYTMSELLTTISTIVTSILSNVTTVATTITTTPLLALSLGFFFVGGVVGIIGRLLSRN